LNSGANDVGKNVFPGSFGAGLVFRWLFNVVDDEDLGGSFGEDKFESKLLLNGGEEGRGVGVALVAGWVGGVGADG
jgi:hypothetical protein